VAQGFSQQPGWDIVESFTSTIHLSVVCAHFALVAADDLECNSINITTAFLNGDLGGDITWSCQRAMSSIQRMVHCSTACSWRCSMASSKVKGSGISSSVRLWRRLGLGRCKVNPVSMCGKTALERRWFTNLCGWLSHHCKNQGGHSAH